MRTFISFVMMSVLVCGIAASAEQTEPVSQEQILQELRQLRQEVAELRRTVEALQARLDEGAEPTELPWADSLRGLDAEDSGVDRNTLGQIKLPDNPSKEQVREYVARILAASRAQRTFSSIDPQVHMLARVGAGHIDVLVQAAEYSPMADVYVVWAIDRLARPEHKALVLDALPRLPELVQVVLARGWLEDAKGTLVEGLRYRECLPTEWVQAVASFKDPDTYAGLKYYFVHGANRRDTYGAIKHLPGIELSDAVAQAWRRSRPSRWEAARIAPIAIEWGHLDALAYAVSALTGTPRPDHALYDMWGLWTAVLRHSDAPRSAEGLKSWFEGNRDNLVFDPETRKFRVKGDQ